VVELDRFAAAASSEWMTLQGLPLLVMVVPPDTPFGPVVMVLVCALTAAENATNAQKQSVLRNMITSCVECRGNGRDQKTAPIRDTKG